MKQFFFLSGLPRSGSTVLASILSQNPDLYASPNSALVELLVNVRDHLRRIEQTRAFSQETQERDVLLGIMEGMYQFTDKPYVLDKSRAWPHTKNIELLTEILPDPPKFVALVRDLPSILTSFISLIYANPDSLGYIDLALQKKGLVCTNENRCAYLFTPGGTVYESWHTMKMAFDAGFADLFHVVEYDDFMQQPKQTIASVYEFLGIPAYDHDLAHIENKTPEDDSVYKLSGMHAIRPVLEKQSNDPIKTLGTELVAKYGAVDHFWRDDETRAKAKPSHASHNPFALRGTQTNGTKL